MNKMFEGSKEIARKFWGYILKHKLVAIIVALVLVASVVVVVNSARKQAETLGTLQMATIERGTLTATIGATGNVRANQTAVLTWQTSGTVGTVNVEIGDSVKADETLAELSPASMSQSIILAQADLVTAQRSLDNLINSGTQTAQAQLSLVQAQKAYDSVKATLDGFLSANHGGSALDIQNARAQVTLAQKTLDQAQSFYDGVKDRPDTDIAKAQAVTGLYNARLAFRRAQSTLNYFTLVPTGRDVDEARAKFALAEAQLEDAQREWERLKNGPDGNDILSAQARVDAARATFRMSQIHAPFAGTVTEASPTVGDLVTPGSSAFRVDDLSRLLVDVQISEVDINTVQIGQPVLVTFDAVLGQEFHGSVVQVDKAGAISQGVVNFGITIELEDADEQVKPGMTAAVTITIEQRQDVLLVPNRAVRLVDGERVVYVFTNGVMTTVAITLGASSDTYSEVVAGDLSAGDEVILNPSTDLLMGGGSRPGFMGP